MQAHTGLLTVLTTQPKELPARPQTGDREWFIDGGCQVIKRKAWSWTVVGKMLP
jgi:hypothetical protein